MVLEPESQIGYLEGVHINMNLTRGKDGGSGAKNENKIGKKKVSK